MFCKVGDIVEFIADTEPNPLEKEQTAKIERGSRYRVIGLVNYGWDLQKEDGSGPELVRILDSQMGNYVRVVATETH